MVFGDILSARPSALEGLDSKHEVGNQTRKDTRQPHQCQAKQGRQEARFKAMDELKVALNTLL